MQGDGRESKLGREMDSWYSCLKQGLSRRIPKDRIGGQERNQINIQEDLKNLQPFVVKHWKRSLLGVALIILTSLLSFPQPLITRYLIDDVILGGQLGLLAGAVLLLIGISLASTVASLLQQFYFTRFEQEVILDIQHNLLERALSFPKSFFDAHQTGYLMSRLSADVQGLKWFFSSTIVHIITNILQFIGGAALLIYLNWKLAIGILGVLPLIFFLVRYFSDKVHALSWQSMEQHANFFSRFQESLSVVPLIKAFSSEGRTVGRLMSELKAMFRLSLEQSTVGSVSSLAINSMPALARLFVLAAGAYWVIKGQWTLGSLLAFQAYLGYLFGPAQFLASTNIELQDARASLERVSALFDIVPEGNVGTGKKVERLTGDVEFRNVSFSYDTRESVLEDITFRVLPGEHVAIVGPSGVGKTTLVSLILRFYRPSSGEIYFDGLPGKAYEVSSLRRRIGYVSQSTLLLTGTIMENLRYGNPEATEEQVIHTAKVADIHEFIMGLPAGYETEIGEKGVNLSEGQKQRLSIARALVIEPDILVLDEPTSALDSMTEKSIFWSLPAVVGGKTLFVVAHRLSTIKDSDRIILLDRNGLVAIGTHQSLSETHDYYRSLVAYQGAQPEMEPLAQA